MAETDVFQFSKLKLFAGITENLPECASDIIDVYEDLLFAWNFKDCNLYVTNWRSTQANKDVNFVKCQTLIPSSTLNFTVSKVLISHGGGYAAISGSQGLSVIELPTRWGSDGLYHDGKSQVTCKVVDIHEYTANTNQLEVVQTRWHHNSPTDSHLLVLYSDNSLKVYDEGNLKHTWRVGPMPNSSRSEGKFSFLKSLGDTAIDFDVAPAQICNDYSAECSSYFANSSLSTTKRHLIRDENKKIEWPIVILRGNGNIYVICAGFSTENPRLQGPLTMLPSQRSNYGDDSCSLLVIPSMPVTLVIAENSGILHHALMIESSFADNGCDDHSLDESKSVSNRFDWDLFVVESIELELGLQEEKLKEEESNILLKRDATNENRYFCYHDAGLHGITMGFIHQLQKYIFGEEEFHFATPSRAEYILSTRAFSTSQCNSVIGFAMLQSPSGILVLMRSGQTVSLRTSKVMPLQYTLRLQLPEMEQKTIESLPKISFDQYIKSMLKSSEGTQLPILKLDPKTSPSLTQALQLLMSSIQLMRANQFIKHDKVRQEIMKRVKILELMKNQQRDEISALLECKKTIQEKAYKLADKHEDIIERQCRLQKRINEVCRLASLKTPTNLAYEKEFSDHIRLLKVKVEKLDQDVIQIKAKHETQKKSLDKWNSNAACEKLPPPPPSSSIHLPPKQEETIKDFIGDMMKQIQGLKSDVQRINNIIDH